MSDALFTVEPGDGDHPGEERVMPTPFARGPWDPGHLHGGPVSAMCVRAAERVVADSSPGPMQFARITVEIERPVPLAPLRIRAELARPGRKVAGVDITVTRDDTNARVARARTLFVRHDDIDLGPSSLISRAALSAGPESAGRTVSTWSSDGVAFHRDACEHRFVSGAWAEPGPVTVWMRLLVPVVAGEVPTGAQRAVALCDFANGLSTALSSDEHLFVNPDLTVHLHSEPVGEWIALEASTQYGPAGMAFSDSAVYDTRGRVGRSNQSLLIEPRA